MYFTLNKVLQLVLLTFFTMISLSGIGQDKPYFDQLKTKFKDYEIATINSADVYRQIDAASRNNEVILDLGGGMKWTMELELNPIFADKYTMVYGTKTLGNPIKEGRVKPMKGKLKNVQNSAVAISFNKNFIFGEIRVGNTAFFIEPLSYHVKGEDPDKFVYYSINDIIVNPEHKCGHELYKEELEKYKSKEENVGTRLPGGCLIVEYAIAADWSMVQKHGSDIDVENHVTGVVNNVQTNYDNEFDDELQFEIVTFWISSCSTCDPWSNSTNSSVVLNSFTDWANTGAFGVTHDVGSMWSNRVYQNNIVGLAWVSVICTSNRYNILRDFTSNANQLRVMTAHELGHNFSAVSSQTGHDPVGSNFIMAPSVNTSTAWSTQSRGDIQSHYLSRWCLSNCTNTPPPVADFDFDIIENCIVGQVQYNDQSTGATSWSWSFPGGTPATSTAQNPLVSYNTVGTFGATLTVTNSAGSDSHTISNVITTNDVPNAGFTYSVNGSTVSFTNTSTNATSYSWDFGDGNLSSETNPTHTYAQDGFYNVVLTAYNECGPAEDSEIIEIATPPTADFSANPESGCSPLSVNFIDESSSNSIQWTWTFEGGVPGQAFVPSPTVIYNQPGLYSVTLTVANPQGSSTLVRQQYIEVLQNPTSSFTYTSNGLTVSFTNTSTNASDFLWNFGDGNTSIQQNPVHTYATGGSYTVTLQASNDCATANSSQVIVLSLAPVAGFTTTTPTEGCVPHTVSFLNTSQNNPTSFEWTFEGGSPATSSELNPVVLYQNPGTFDVTLIVHNALGSDTLEIPDYITVVTTPSVAFTYQANGLTYNFTGILADADSFVWDFGDGSQSTDQNPSHTYAAEGNYTVTLTGQNECGETSSTQGITVLLPPTADFSANVTEGCAPLTVQFTDTSSPNTTQWSWTFPGGNPTTSTSQNPVVTYPSAGTYDVTLVASNAAGQDTRTKSSFIQVNMAPTTGFTIQVDGPTVTLTNTGTGASATEWQIQDNSLITLQGQAVTYTFSANGTYSIRQINTNACGSNNLEQFVMINAFPVAGFIGNANGNCAPVTITFNNTSINSTSFSWTFENGSPATSNEENPVVIFAEAGEYEISLTSTNQYGSNTTSQTILILGIPAPTFTVSLNATTATFTNGTQGNGNTYLWEFGDGSTSSAENPVHVYANPGTYDVVLTVTNECGTEEITSQVVIDNRAPVVSFTASTLSGCAPLEVQFTDESSNDPDSWNWIFEGGNPGSSTEKNPLVVYENEGIYDVRLTVTNSFGSSELLLEDYITVYGPPAATFEYTLVEGTIDLQYTGNQVSSYAWDFGDGNRSAEQSPDHTYTSSGTYTVVLIVENPCGRDTFSREINVMLSSVRQPGLNGRVQIVPNPNQGFFSIVFTEMTGQKVHVELLNILGQTVYTSGHLIHESNERVLIEQPDILPGSYLVKIVNQDGQTLVKKVSIFK